MTSLLANKKFLLRFFSMVSLLTIASMALAQNMPKLNGYVVDDAGLFTAAERELMTQKLQSLADTTSNEVVIYTTLDLQGMDISEFATELGRVNGVGIKGQNNGVVIIIKPKTTDSKGQAFIAPGYGLEGAIPDAIARRIVEDEMIPEFREGNYYAGTFKALDIVSKLASGEFQAKDYKGKKKQKNTGGSAIGLLILLAIFLLFFFSGARSYGRRNNLPFWLALGLFNSVGSKHRGSWGGFSGGGGGGFGGFGGGSFGGGGAGGSW